MSVVGKFFGEFGLDIDPFLKAVRGIQNETKSIVNSLKPVTKAAEDMGKSFTAAGVAITGALGLAVKQAADYGDAIRDASVRTGVGTAALGGLKIAAEQSGASFEDLNVGLKKLAVNADAAAKGSKEQVALFKSMGVAVRDTHGAQRDLADILGDVSEHFKNSTNATKEAGEAVALFGRNGTQLIEFLELGKDGLQQFQEKAEKLGLAIGPNIADQADKFKDTLNDLHAAETGAAIAIGNALLPALTSFSVMLTNTVVEIRKFIDENQTLVKVLAAVGVLLTGTGGLLLGLAGLLTILPKVIEAWKLLNIVMIANPIGAVVTGIALLVAGLVIFRHELAGGLVGTLSFVVYWLGQFTIAVGKILESFGAGGLGRQIESAGESVVKLGRSLKDTRDDLLGLHAPAENMADAFAKARDAFDTAKLKRFADGVIEDAEAAKEAAKIELKYREALNQIYREHVEAAGKFVQAWLDGFERTSEAADKYTESVQRSQVAASKLSMTVGDLHPLNDLTGDVIGVANIDAIVRMQKAWEDANGKTFDDQVELYNKIYGLRKTDLDDKVEFDEAWDKALKKQNEKRAADYKKSIDDVKHSAGAIFDDMFVKGESVFKSLQNMLKGGVLSIGRTIFEDIVGALAGPVLNAFRNFFNTTLKGIIDGALGGIGKSIGTAIGGLIGIGVPHLPGGAAGPVLASGGAGIGLFGLSGAATLGIGAAVAGVALVATHFIGEGRKAAKKFTDASQSQFDSELGSTFNKFQSARAAGTLTLDQATKLQSQMATLLQGITDSANQYGSEGKNQKKVVDQFFAQQQELFGKNWVNLTSQIDTAIAGFKTNPGTPGALARTPDTGRAISASSIFADAVGLFKATMDKFSSGISGGAAVSVNVNSAPVFNISVGSDDLAFQVRDVIIPEALKDFQGDVNAAATKLIQILKPRWDSTPSAGGAAV